VEHGREEAFKPAASPDGLLDSLVDTSQQLGDPSLIFTARHGHG
jgi:hypothetical protein